MADRELVMFRLLDRKVDLVLETQMRHTERLGRLERDIGEVRRLLEDIRELLERSGDD